MLSMEFDSHQYEAVIKHHTCPFHKKHPNEGYAECTCTGMFSWRRKKNKKPKEKRNPFLRNKKGKKV